MKGNKKNFHITKMHLKSENDIECAIRELTECLLSGYKTATKEMSADRWSGRLPLHIRENIKQRNKLRKRYNRTRDPVIKTEINRFHRHIKAQIATYKADALSDKITALNHNDLAFWKFVKKMKGESTLNNSYES